MCHGQWPGKGGRRDNCTAILDTAHRQLKSGNHAQCAVTANRSSCGVRKAACGARAATLGTALPFLQIPRHILRLSQTIPLLQSGFTRSRLATSLSVAQRRTLTEVCWLYIMMSRPRRCIGTGTQCLQPALPRFADPQGWRLLMSSTTSHM